MIIVNTLDIQLFSPHILIIFRMIHFKTYYLYVNGGIFGEIKSGGRIDRGLK